MKYHIQWGKGLPVILEGGSMSYGQCRRIVRNWMWERLREGQTRWIRAKWRACIQQFERQRPVRGVRQ